MTRVPVPPARRGPHAERSAATRGRLLDATVEALVQLGYAGTTTMEIQTRAGVSRGALLHHFASRSDLLVAAVDHLFSAHAANLRERARHLPSGANRLEHAIDLLWASFQEPLFTAALEIWVASRTNPELAAAVARNEPLIAAEALELCADLFGPPFNTHPAYPAFSATLLEAMVATAMARHVRSASVIAEQVAQWKDLGRQATGDLWPEVSD